MGSPYSPVAAIISQGLSRWFRSAESLGEFVGIRFGHLAPGASEPRWHYLSHADFDGIGGLGELLRRHGAELPGLPEGRRLAPPGLAAWGRAGFQFLRPRIRLRWAVPAGPTRPRSAAEPPAAAAWAAEEEPFTRRLRQACRAAGVTVNSLLLHGLVRAFRPFLATSDAVQPWMLPVNLRGGLVRERDVENHSSYLSLRVPPTACLVETHGAIRRALDSGEAWVNWHAYKSGGFLPPAACRMMLRADRAVAQWNLGCFSNLGVWDAEGRFTRPGCAGAWLFAPPVLRCQMVGAGCVTFQNRLGLLIQAHPELTVNPALSSAWLESWRREIRAELARIEAAPG